MKLSLPTSVFVPFEWNGKTWEKRDDLPRFVHTNEVIKYLTTHPEKSFRKRPFFMVPEHIRLEWREHSERDLIKEFTDGVGTPAWLEKKFNKR
jgi:hypothetical protein